MTIATFDAIFRIPSTSPAASETNTGSFRIGWLDDAEDPPGKGIYLDVTIADLITAGLAWKGADHSPVDGESDVLVYLEFDTWYAARVAFDSELLTATLTFGLAGGPVYDLVTDISIFIAGGMGLGFQLHKTDGEASYQPKAQVDFISTSLGPITRYDP